MLTASEWELGGAGEPKGGKLGKGLKCVALACYKLKLQLSENKKTFESCNHSFLLFSWLFYTLSPKEQQQKSQMKTKSSMCPSYYVCPGACRTNGGSLSAPSHNTTQCGTATVFARKNVSTYICLVQWNWFTDVTGCTCRFHASCDVRESISLHQAVLIQWWQKFIFQNDLRISKISGVLQPWQYFAYLFRCYGIWKICRK